MARTVSDLAMLLSVQAGYDPRAPLSVTEDGRHFLGLLASNLKGKRIGWLGDLGGWAPYEAGVLDVCRTALKSFEALGCVVEEAVPDQPPEPAWQAFIKLRQWQQGAGLLAYYKDPAKRALLKPEAIWEIEGGLKLTAYDIDAASAVRTAWSATVQRLFARFDYLIMPTAQLFPFAVGGNLAAHPGGPDHADLSRMDEGGLPDHHGGLSVPGGAGRLRRQWPLHGPSDHRARAS